MSKRTALASLVLLAPSAAPCAAQTLYELLGQSAGEGFGRAVSSAGDVDLDGVPDVLIGSAWVPKVSLHSGSTGALIRTHDFQGLALASLGDVTGDGRSDYVCGEFSGGGAVRLVSGSDGTVLHTWSEDGSGIFGASVAGLGDVNGDGVPDVALGDLETAGTPGSVRVYSGASHGLLWQVQGGPLAVGFGDSLSNAGDVDGDGRDDLLVGDYNLSSSQLLSGSNGSLIHAWPSGTTDEVVGLGGDVDGDGVPDLVLLQQGLHGQVAVRAYSGADASQLYEIDLQDAQSNPSSASPVGDVDLDGKPDLLLAFEGADVPFPNAGEVRVYSGASGAHLLTVNGAQLGGYFGTSVGFLGDVNADGTPELLVGASGEASDRGRVHVISPVIAAPPDCNLNGIDDAVDILSGTSTDTDSDGVPDECVCTVTTYCSANPNSTGLTAHIYAQGSTSVAANNLRLVSENCPPNQFGIFIYSLDAGESPFGPGFLCLTGQIIRLPVVNSGSGAATYLVHNTTLPNPNGQLTGGSTWHFQFWHRDIVAPGFNLSDGMTIVFCP